MRVLVVLPTYQEAGNIEAVLRGVSGAVPGVNILVVDDASPDGTAKFAEALAAELGGIEVMCRPRKSGLGSAYIAGFTWGLEQGYEAFVEMDSDLSHDPASLPDLLEPLKRGTGLVIGSRYIPGGSIPRWSVHRRAVSRWGNVYAATMLGIQVADLTSGYRAYSSSALRRIDLGRVRADSYGFQIEMAYKVMLSGMAIEEVPIRFVDRVEGRSKFSTYTVVEALGLVTLWGLKRMIGAAPAPSASPIVAATPVTDSSDS